MKQTLKTLIKILVILILYFLTQALVMTVFAAIGGMGVQGDIQGAMEAFLEEKAALISLTHNALIILCLLLYRRRNSAAKEEMPFRSLSIGELGCCAGAGVCAAFVVTLLLSLLPIPEELMTSYSSAVTASTSGAPLEKLLSVVILAPMAEELLFRGAIYGSFKNTSRPVVAVAASCAIFGIMHQDPIWMIYAFLMGLGLTLVLDAYGTLLAPILLHIAFNFTGSYITPLMSGMPIYIPMLFTIGCAYVLSCCIKHMKQHKDTPEGEGK